MSRTRWVLYVALVCTGAFATASTIRRNQSRSQVLAYTECPFVGTARVVVMPDVAPEDTTPVRVHEEVHAAQCRSLGPIRYRVRNLTATGKLSLELPAYCAAARARLASGQAARAVRERMHDDVHAVFDGSVDSATIARGLQSQCPPR